ncbi:GLPGLI family protein [Chryseobacterium sp. G0186]|uniref:GLPGLI family protein n=1 Tax=Chryseobacterium sp. G0186 TaxID=2487064 RepID=UPI0013DE17CD|nr:GLPGLI family protein [Chryseobacterium sp. G0186]
MKTLINTTFLVFAVQFMKAQKIRVTYHLKYKTDSLQVINKENTMLLDIYDSNISRFYSEKLYKSDSIRKKGTSEQYYSLDFNHAITRNKTLLKKYYRILTDVYEITEETPNLEWKINSNKKKIGDYECQSAILKYKNRQWTTWFTQDIPIPEGPSFFKGLPGLVVWVYDEKANYDFLLKKLTKGFYDPYPDFDFHSENIVKVNKDQLNKIYINYYLDPYREAKMGKIKMSFVDEKGNEIKNINWNELSKNKQAEIKRNNNPIELSDVIKYSN